jgi:hypothetical protein
MNCHVCPSKPCLPQSYSASRRTASHAGFFILSQSGDPPDRYCESLRFETMPSNTISPSLCSRCSFSRRPGLSERNVRIWGRIVRRDRRLVAALGQAHSGRNRHIWSTTRPSFRPCLGPHTRCDCKRRTTRKPIQPSSSCHFSCAAALAASSSLTASSSDTGPEDRCNSSS